MTQMANELGGVAAVEMGGVPHGSCLEKAEQMVGSRAVSCDGLDGGTQDLLVVFQPAAPQFGKGQWLETQGRGSADLELRVDLGGKLPGSLLVRADAGAASLPVVAVAQIPNLAAEVGENLADAE